MWPLLSIIIGTSNLLEAFELRLSLNLASVLPSKACENAVDILLVPVRKAECACMYDG